MRVNASNTVRFVGISSYDGGKLRTKLTDIFAVLSFLICLNRNIFLLTSDLLSTL